METPTIRATQPEMKRDPVAASGNQASGILQECRSFRHFVRRDHMQDRYVHSND
jgi:hypothetical protein